MTKTAVLLNPQVVIQPGDYHDMYSSSAVVRDLFDEASEAVGFDLPKAFLSDDPERINSGPVVRPASLVLATAIHRMTSHGRPEPDYFAGLSLGEVVAGHLSGHMSFADAVRMTHLMPRIEDEVRAGAEYGVAFYYGVDVARLRDRMAELVDRGEELSPCAYTADDQMIVTGTAAALRELNLKAVSCGGLGVPIRYGPPAHSPLPLLREVQRRFRDEWHYLDPARDPRVPVLANTTSELLTTAADMTDAYVRQYVTTVHWSRGLYRLHDLGVRRVRIIGPGHFVMKSLRSTGVDFEVETCLTTDDLARVLS
ncbi:hypothetical protein [Streptomyces sp. NPDC048057]|uniref:ACP S-malonyltransferase n=1 Tax=Streptomyces sp. NPDC048057 TaxID=3155628 RepID=UPI003409AB52